MAGSDPKLDLKKELKQFYGPSSREVSVVDVPPINYIMVDGEGDPNTAQAYQDAVGELYAVAYTVKFALKGASKGPDFVVMPLEGLWWADDIDDFQKASKANWKWTAMIALPDFVTEADVADAKRRAAEKKEIPSLDALRFERFREGPTAQIMYIGPYADEAQTIASLHDFIAASGKRLSGRHHEIYLSDPRRTEPAKLKTVIRQPFS